MNKGRKMKHLKDFSPVATILTGGSAPSTHFLEKVSQIVSKIKFFLKFAPTFVIN